MKAASHGVCRLDLCMKYLFVARRHSWSRIAKKFFYLRRRPFMRITYWRTLVHALVQDNSTSCRRASAVLHFASGYKSVLHSSMDTCIVSRTSISVQVEDFSCFGLFMDCSNLAWHTRPLCIFLSMSIAIA